MKENYRFESDSPAICLKTVLPEIVFSFQIAILPYTVLKRLRMIFLLNPSGGLPNPIGCLRDPIEGFPGPSQS